ncbi:hypothetical protein JCM10449v2_005007 [Rhodotorula kratochvilovae]
MFDQALIDYLCIHLIEEDVVYSVHRLQQMHTAGMIDPWEEAHGLTSRNSYKTHTPLTALAISPHSEIRFFLLALLLLYLDAKDAIAHLEKNGKYEGWIKDALEQWPASKEEFALSAKEVMQLKMSDAKRWVLNKFPTHAPLVSLTGMMPLPPRNALEQKKPRTHASPAPFPSPAFSSIPTDPFSPARDDSHFPAQQQQPAPVQGFVPASFPAHVNEHAGPPLATAQRRPPESATTPRRGRIVSSSSRRLHLGNLPRGATKEEMQRLLAKFGILFSDLSVSSRSRHNRRDNGAAYFTVPSGADHQRAEDALHGAILGDRELFLEREIIKTVLPNHPLVKSREGPVLVGMNADAGTCTGTALLRAYSPASASNVVAFLDGKVLDGYTLSARVEAQEGGDVPPWRHQQGAMGAYAPPSTPQPSSSSAGAPRRVPLHQQQYVPPSGAGGPSGSWGSSLSTYASGKALAPAASGPAPAPAPANSFASMAAAAQRASGAQPSTYRLDAYAPPPPCMPQYGRARPASAFSDDTPVAKKVKRG